MGGGFKSLYSDDKYEGGNGISELQMMRICTMDDNENVNRAVVGFLLDTK